MRARRIAALYPRPLTSLLDLSCSKGYFVFDAADRPACRRAMGVDVYGPDIEACRAVDQFRRGQGQGRGHTSFECLPLHELATRIDSFGGAFQTTLLVNTYQYMYFGSGRARGYLDHDVIFSHLNRVCGETLIFANRIEVEECQNTAEVAAAGPRCAADYARAPILAAAARHFDVVPAAPLGRYPVWRLLKR
jgi:hypothetical protein